MWDGLESQLDTVLFMNHKSPPLRTEHCGALIAELSLLIKDLVVMTLMFICTQRTRGSLISSGAEVVYAAIMPSVIVYYCSSVITCHIDIVLQMDPIVCTMKDPWGIDGLQQQASFPHQAAAKITSVWSNPCSLKDLYPMYRGFYLIPFMYMNKEHCQLSEELFSNSSNAIADTL